MLAHTLAHFLHTQICLCLSAFANISYWSRQTIYQPTDSFNTLCYHSQLVFALACPCWGYNYWAVMFLSSRQRKDGWPVLRWRAWKSAGPNFCTGQEPEACEQGCETEERRWQKQLFSSKHDKPTAICDRRRGPTVLGRVRKIVRSILAALTHKQTISAAQIYNISARWEQPEMEDILTGKMN